MKNKHIDKIDKSYYNDSYQIADCCFDVKEQSYRHCFRLGFDTELPCWGQVAWSDEYNPDVGYDFVGHLCEGHRGYPWSKYETEI